ncbi:MAG: transcriptional regulator [Candidatus Reconcilbacillus cellulovorans]|uniref:Transcriptional regulator n=1 Tax=Candidatus Reconcilbacillus cellulovorans TaxID=1906605 RepID=A0A2A6E2R3_9BACL|nr:MAG: transcriptional regulator [Candidatus Reconcilbacillus cellulovorans]
MAIGDAIEAFRRESGMSQAELAKHLHFDRSMISRIENGERAWPEAHDAKLASMSWKLALKLAEERTGGYISNMLDDVPNLDLHPAALKDLLLKELRELYAVLEGTALARHVDPEKKREQAERIWMEMRDVQAVAAVLQGVIEEEFGLDRKRLIQKYDMEVKRGER